ncbi:GNAT family N-acetyltransferase [Paenibacillus sp. FSL R10-2736]|uniref:GNAT family N-acetyltransferase n=1 Tax=Paenibacillus sp. FSL R10-2736 TaxID=2954692 RepID=UPI0030FA1A6E
MNRIQRITDRNQAVLQELLDIWETAVRATHLFLTEQDIEGLRPLVHQGIGHISHLLAYTGQEHVQEQKIEMLFVDPAVRGQGIGKQLVTYALHTLNVLYVDVNEQNPQALGFYEHLGFQVYDRSERDEQGQPWPILHMKLSQI